MKPKSSLFIRLVLFALFMPVGNSMAQHEHGSHETGTEHAEESEEFLEFHWSEASQEGVEFVAARSVTIQNKQSFYGETVINGNSLAHVVARFPGTLKQVPKRLGDSVRAGEVLATVESNQSLAGYQIKAAIDGVIIDQDATKGEFVASDKVLFKLANLETTWANFAVPPRLLSWLSVGTPATIISQSTDSRLESKIAYIRPTLSEETRMGNARIEIPNESNEWPPGLFVTIVVKIAGNQFDVGVPDSSLLLVENKPTVFVRAKAADGDEGFEIRHLKVGSSDGDWVEVVSGLKSGETVAAGNTFILKAELGKSAAEHSH